MNLDHQDRLTPNGYVEAGLRMKQEALNILWFQGFAAHAFNPKKNYCDFWRVLKLGAPARTNAHPGSPHKRNQGPELDLMHTFT